MFEYLFKYPAPVFTKGRIVFSLCMASLVAGGSDRGFFSEPGSVDVSKNLRHRAKAEELAVVGALDDAIRICRTDPSAAVAACNDALRP